jgi:hypothetical protein
MYYVYQLIDPRDGSVFYVGKGVGNRVNHHVLMSSKGRHYNPKLQRKIAKITGLGLTIRGEKIFADPDEQVCFQKEKEMIAQYGRATLCNLTDGGDGLPKLDAEALERRSIKVSATLMGHPVSDETRRKLSNRHKGKKLSESTKRKLSIATKGTRMGPANHRFGIPHTAEWKARASLLFSGRRISEEQKLKISAANTGKKRSEEAKAKMRAAKIGRRLSPEHKAKISAAITGRPCSTQARDKIAAAKRGKIMSSAARAKMSAAKIGRRLRQGTVTPQIPHSQLVSGVGGGQEKVDIRHVEAKVKPALEGTPK